MNIIKNLELLIGGRWVGIIFHDHESAMGKKADKAVRFCEAIANSILHPLVLSPEMLCCAGGLRSFGWSDRSQDELVKAISEKSGMPGDAVFRLVASTPLLRDAPKEVTIGVKENPDLVISYALPESAMMLVRQVQERTGENLSVEISSIMSVCGNVAVRAHLSQRICISFGCMDSREATKMGSDRLIIGIPKSAFDYFDIKEYATDEMVKVS